MALGKLRATFADGTEAEADLTYAAIVAAERHFKRGSATFLDKELEPMMWILWHTLKFSGQHPEIGTFEAWLRTVADFAGEPPDEGETDAANPTEPLPMPPERYAPQPTGNPDGATPPQA